MGGIRRGIAVGLITIYIDPWAIYENPLTSVKPSTGDY